MGRVGHIFVMVQNEKEPTDAEWDGFLKLLIDNREDLPKLGLLVITPGGAPNAAQRKRLQTALAGRPMAVAVISDDIKMRFIASLIHLFHKGHQLFPSGDIAKAYTHLNLTTGEKVRVEAIVRELREQV